MILFKIGDETPYMPLNLCLKFQHKEYQKTVSEILKARKETNIESETETEGKDPLQEIGEYEEVEKYKDLKVSLRMTSADDYYLVSAKISELAARNKAGEVSKIDLNIEMKNLQRNFLKKALVGVKGFTDEAGKPFELTNSDADILALDGGHYMADIFSVCQYYQGLNAAEKKRFKQSEVSI